MNDIFHWRMLSFQSPFKENEIWIICTATCFKEKANHNKKALEIKNFFYFRNSHWRCSVEKGVLKNFTNFTGKHLSGVSF